MGRICRRQFTRSCPVASRPEYYYYKDFHITYNNYSLLDDILNNFTHADGCPSFCLSVGLPITSGKRNSS